MDLTVVVDGREIDTCYNNDVNPEGPLRDVPLFGPSVTSDGRIRRFSVTVKRDYEGFENPGNRATIYRPDGALFEVSIVGLDLDDLPAGKTVRLSVRNKKIEAFLDGR